MNAACKKGFSLIEVTLAILVTAIGLMAVFSLLPFGLASSRTAVDETRISHFAEETFGAYRMLASQVGWTNLTSFIPSELPAGMLEYDVAPAFTTGNDVLTNRYGVMVGGVYIQDYAFRFKLTNHVVDVRTIGLTLRVWPGEYGSKDDVQNNTNDISFYAEIFNYAM